MKAFSHDLNSAYDSDTYLGRLKHFQKLVNPLNLLYSNEKLMEYKDILLKHKNNMISREKQYNEEELWKMKYRNYIYIYYKYIIFSFLLFVSSLINLNLY